MYVAPFERVPGLGRFILRDEGVIMGMGRIVELKQKHCCVCFPANKQVTRSVHVASVAVRPSLRRRLSCR